MDYERNLLISWSKYKRNASVGIPDLGLGSVIDAQVHPHFEAWFSECADKAYFNKYCSKAPFDYIAISNVKSDSIDISRINILKLQHIIKAEYIEFLIESGGREPKYIIIGRDVMTLVLGSDTVPERDFSIENVIYGHRVIYAHRGTGVTIIQEVD